MKKKVSKPRLKGKKGECGGTPAAGNAGDDKPTGRMRRNRRTK